MIAKARRPAAAAPPLLAGRQYHPAMRIRLAEMADAEAIRTIYNVEVLESTNTFDMVPRTRAEQETWILEHSGVHPAVVAIESPEPGPSGANGEIVLGFGSLSRVPGTIGLLGDGGKLGLCRPCPSGTRSRERAPGRVDRAGVGPRVPLADRTDRRPQRDVHWPPHGRWLRAGRGGTRGRPQAPPMAGCRGAPAPSLSEAPPSAQRLGVRAGFPGPRRRLARRQE